MSDRIDAVIPALNENETVARVVQTLRKSERIGQVIVVDNHSDDCTAQAARDAGAIVIDCKQRGLGVAVKAGIRATASRRILRTDADISNWDLIWLDKLLSVGPGDLVRACFQSPYDEFPVTRLVAEPLLRMVLPQAATYPLPLTGTYIFNREAFNFDILGDDWSFDISILCEAVRRGVDILNVDIGVLADRERPMSHYVPMATDVMKYLLMKSE